MTVMTYDTPLRTRPAARPAGPPAGLPAARPAGAPAARSAAPPVPPVRVPAAAATPARVVPLAVSGRPGRAVRLTRRGRALLLLVLVALLLVAFSLGRTSADAGHGAPAVRATTVVQPGETLWAIARRVAPRTDPRATVERLTRLNDLGGRPIVAGQRLVLPG